MWCLPGSCLSDGGVFLVSGTLTRCLESLEGQTDSPEEAKTTDALKQVCHHDLIVTLGPYSSLLGMLGIMQGLVLVYMGSSSVLVLIGSHSLCNSFVVNQFLFFTPNGENSLCYTPKKQ